MNSKLLQKKHSTLIKVADISNGRKATVSYFHKDEKIRISIKKIFKRNCPKCNGIGHLRISLERAKTCLRCYGKGFITNGFRNNY